jgi:hypothetical protein
MFASRSQQNKEESGHSAVRSISQSESQARLKVESSGPGSFTPGFALTSSGRYLGPTPDPGLRGPRLHSLREFVAPRRRGDADGDALSQHWQGACAHDRSSREAIMARMDGAQMYTHEEERGIARGLELLDLFAGDASQEQALKQSYATLSRERTKTDTRAQMLVGSSEAIIRGGPCVPCVACEPPFLRPPPRAS